MKILIVSGSSGGHIFPAISLIKALKSEYNVSDILLVLPRQNAVSGRRDFCCAVKYIPASPITARLSFKNLKNIFYFAAAFFESFFIIASFKPDAVAGFGGLASIPVILSAWLFRIRTVIHEQNVLPGKANKFLAGFSGKIAVSFKETAGLFKGYEKKVVFTGNPIRQGLTRSAKKDALDFFKLEYNKLTLLVMGGSQGCRNLNKAVPQVISKLPQKDKIQVIHLCGDKDYDFVNEQYNLSGVVSRSFKFLDAVSYAYSASDLVISRSGASTIAELIKFKVPALLVPYPYAGAHQAQNAMVLSRADCAIIVGDDCLEKGQFKEAMASLISSPERLAVMTDNYRVFADIDAAGLLAGEVVKC